MHAIYIVFASRLDPDEPVGWQAQLAKLTNKKVVLAASSPPADDSLIDDDNPFADSDDEPAPKGGAASAPEVIDDFDALFA